MGTDEKGTHDPWISMAISVGKDLVSLLRDSALFVLAILLVAFPAQFNSILVDAGFKEGNVAGFKWQPSLVTSTQDLKEAQAKIAELQKVNNEQANALTQARAQLTDPALKQRIAKLEENSSALQESTELVQSSVSQTIKANLTLIDKAQPSRKKSDYLVGLQTVGIPDTERITINKKLSSEGYSLDDITWSYAAKDRPSWFATRSTVFYYSASALPAAQELASFMKTVTKQDFAVQRGAGLGVNPSLRNVTLYVHLLKG
jgi:hypothetical protein